MASGKTLAGRLIQRIPSLSRAGPRNLSIAEPGARRAADGPGTMRGGLQFNVGDHLATVEHPSVEPLKEQPMKVVFHDRFRKEYAADPAAARGRMESMVETLEKKHDFVAPEPATEEDLARVHGRAHIREIRQSARTPDSVITLIRS